MKNKPELKQLTINTNVAHAMFQTLSKLGFEVKFSRSMKISQGWDDLYDCWQYARRYGQK